MHYIHRLKSKVGTAVNILKSEGVYGVAHHTWTKFAAPIDDSISSEPPLPPAQTPPAEIQEDTSAAPPNDQVVGENISAVEDIFVNYPDDDLFKVLPDNPVANSLVLRPDIKKYIVSDRDIPLPIQEMRGRALKSLDDLSNSEIKNALFFVYFTCDSDALPVLKKIKECGGHFIPHNGFAKTSYRFVNRVVHSALRKTWAKSERVSHLVPIIHENICEALELTRSIDGDYVEIGVYLGGSALTALNYMAEANIKRKAYLLDTFEGFDYKEAEDSSDVMWANTHQLYGVEATKVHLAATLGDTGTEFELIESNICSDEIPSEIENIAVANVDVDLYEPTLAALHKIAPLISIGGIIIAEDPTATPALYGAYLAMSEFLATEIGKRFLPIFKYGQYFLLRR